MQGAEEMSILRSRSPAHAHDLIEFTGNFLNAIGVRERPDEERLRRAAATLAGDQLVALRTAIATLLTPALPLGQPLTPESRVAAAVLFRQIAEALAW